MYNIEKIECQPGDVLIVTFNIDKYDIEDANRIFKNLAAAFPRNQVIMIPNDAIAGIDIISSQPKFLEFDGTATTQTIQIGEPFRWNTQQPYETISMLQEYINNHSTVGESDSTNGNLY